MLDWILTAEAEECRLLAAELADKPEAPLLLHLASAFDDLHVGKVNLPPKERSMTPMSEFIARENIRRFKAQLLTAEEGTRKAMLRRLLDDQEDHLGDLLAGKE
jgi:hypothetical protein